MKEWIKMFGKTFLLMSLPIYGGILWGFLELGIYYWYAWILTNLAYTPIIFLVNRFLIFKKGGDKNDKRRKRMVNQVL